MKKLKIVNVFVILALLVSLIFTSSITVNAANVWTMQQGTMSTGRDHLASAVVNGKIYAIGGDGSGYQENYTIEEYNPATATWAVKAVSHLPRIYFSVAVVNNKIYIIGGSHQGVPYQYDTAVEEYDPLAGTITTKSPMPTAREFMGVVAVNNKIYAIGGFNSSGIKSTIEVYDPATDTWTSRPDMATAKYLFAIGQANGKIYIVGGHVNNNVISQEVKEYNPVGDVWTSKTDLPISWDTDVATSLDGKIYVAGGGIQYVYNQKVVKEYDPLHDTWTNMPDMLKGMTSGELAALNGKIYAFGGELDTPKGQIEMLDVDNYCAKWALDGNGNDSSGNGNNGTLVGSPATVAGILGQALSFNGSNYVTIPNSSTVNFGTGDFSIGFWVNTTSTNGCNTLIEKRSSTYVGYDISIYGGKLLLQIGDPSGYSNFVNYTGPSINNGAWHYAVVTVDRDSTTGIKFYIDGALTVSFDPTARQGSISNSESLYIGKHRDSPSCNFVGAADQVKMYTRVLTPSEVLQQYTNP